LIRIPKKKIRSLKPTYVSARFLNQTVKQQNTFSLYQKYFDKCYHCSSSLLFRRKLSQLSYQKINILIKKNKNKEYKKNLDYKKNNKS